MREIKFRIWLDGYWRYWGFIREEVTRHLVFASLPSSSGESLTMEEMMERSQEYTGLKDKTGKEIYQKDILKWVHHRCEDCGKEDYSIGVVSFGSMGAMVCGYPICDPRCADKDIEVIGNIYEHPELLEAK